VPYTHTTRAQARTQLAGLLHDTGNVFWTSAELDVYLDEALRTWGVAAQYWRERGTLSTSSSTAFYDLTSTLAPSTLRGQIVTDTNLVRDIQYHLLEPATGTSWTGSEQFTFAQVQNALQRRRDQFLVETGCHLTLVTTAVGAPPDGRFIVADTIIDVRRAVWLDSNSYRTVVWRTDEHAAQAFDGGWLQNPGNPDSYSVSVAPPLTVQLFPPPLSSGSLELITVSSGATLDPANGVVMGVPDDFTWAVKFGALADLLGKDGQAYDPGRSAYCEQRFQEGVQLARIATSVVQAQIANVPKPINALYEQDAYDGNWQNLTGTPGECFLAGLNVIGFSRVPSGAFGVSLDVLRNAPIPATDAAFLEVGREELEAIVQYAQHLASFKMGGEEFEATVPHYQRFMGLAALRNARLNAAAGNFAVLRDRAQREEGGRARVEVMA
jgi:hypothetical protein